jgi:transcriptional regulator with XRE-family HTH domain
MAQAFDEVAFFQAVEARRQAEGLSWRELGRRLGLSPSTFSRLSRGRRPDVETFVTVLAWLDVPADAFIARTPGSPAKKGRALPLRVIGAALRDDPRLSPEDVQPLEDIIRVAYNRFSRRSS